MNLLLLSFNHPLMKIQLDRIVYYKPPSKLKIMFITTKNDEISEAEKFKNRKHIVKSISNSSFLSIPKVDEYLLTFS